VKQPDRSVWHRAYERPGGALGQRLVIVRRLIRGLVRRTVHVTSRMRIGAHMLNA